MMSQEAPHREERVTLLGDPAFASALARYVRTRVPASEVDDIVQSTLADALASTHAPATRAELSPWVYGIAKNKIADFFRRSRREVPQEPSVHEEVAAAESAPTSARDLLRWAEKELPPGDEQKSTLEWMLREGSGEKLEAIAAEANVPAPRVRQRVARMRKHYRARWAAQLAAVAVLIAAVIAIVVFFRNKREEIAVPVPPSSAPLPETPSPDVKEKADGLRKLAFEACNAAAWQRCLDRLDEAKELDPAGDADARVQRARKAAKDALEAPTPPPSASPSAAIPAPPSSADTKSVKGPEGGKRQPAPTLIRPRAPSSAPSPVPTAGPKDAFQGSSSMLEPSPASSDAVTKLPPFAK